MNENTSIMVCIIPNNLPRSYMYKMHNYLVVFSVRYFIEGGHFENGPYNIVNPK